MHLRFDRGTLLFDACTGPVEIRQLPGVLWDPRVNALRAPAHRYGAITAALRQGGVRFSVDLPGYRPISGRFGDIELRPYQAEALDAWALCGRRGIVVLPTGSGKTRVAIAAIARAGTSAICLVPTRVLLEQWCGELARFYDGPIGRLGDGDRRVEPLTVSTFESAYRHMSEIGGRFGMLVVDEVHHFGGTARDEALAMCVAPARLGLTATMPQQRAEAEERVEAVKRDQAEERVEAVKRDQAEERPRHDRVDETMDLTDETMDLTDETMDLTDETMDLTDETMDLTDLIGPAVFELTIQDLAGTFLADLDLITVSVDLSAVERHRYDEHMARFRLVFGQFHALAPGANWAEFLTAAGQTPEGRQGVEAWRSARQLLAYNSGKAAAVAALLRRHRETRVLVFTADNETAYAIARTHLIMPITCDIGRAERADALRRFRLGQLRALVSARVLNEGLDVPAADVAIVVGGTQGQREHVQRVGRILRPAPGKRALVYELVVRHTGEVARARERRQGLVPRQAAAVHV